MPAKLHKNHQIMYFLSTSSSFFIIFLKLWSHFTNIICIFAVSSGRNPDWWCIAYWYALNRRCLEN